MTKEEMLNETAVKEAFELYSTALVEGGVDYDGVESVFNRILNDKKSVENVLESLMQDAVETLSNYAPDTRDEDMAFSYQITDGKAELIIEALEADIDPVVYYDGAIHEFKEQLEELQEEENGYDYDDEEYDD